jgi:hypothetical protein
MPNRRRTSDHPRVLRALGTNTSTPTNSTPTEVPVVADSAPLPKIEEPVTDESLMTWLRATIPSLDPASDYRRKLELIVRRQELRDIHKRNVTAAFSNAS